MKNSHNDGTTDKEGAQTLTLAKIVSLFSLFIKYIFYAVYGIISFAALLILAGARSSSRIKQSVDMLAHPLLAPFASVLPKVSTGEMRTLLSYGMTFIIYILIQVAIYRLLKLAEHKR